MHKEAMLPCKSSKSTGAPLSSSTKILMNANIHQNLMNPIALGDLGWTGSVPLKSMEALPLPCFELRFFFLLPFLQGMPESFNIA